MKRIITIIIEGQYTGDLNSKNEYIFISKKEPQEDLKCKWLQINYEDPEELIKTIQIIKMDFEKIDEIQIIYNNQKLNMLSYQYDYEFLKNLYLNQTANIIFLINLMVSLFNKKILININSGDFSHYQAHNKNWYNSICLYLDSLKKDLVPKIEITLSIKNTEGIAL